MRCPRCGEENLSSSKVCEVCGYPLVQVSRPANKPNEFPPRPAVQGRSPRPVQARPTGTPAAHGKAPVRKKKKKTRWNPKFLAACAGILLVLILVPILIAIAVHHGDSIESRRIQMFYSGHSGKTSVVLNGKVYEKTISGKVDRTASSRDGLTQAVLNDAGELYYITSQKLDVVASGVQNFVLSADGGKLAYVLENLPEASDTSESDTQEETTTGRAKSSATEDTTEESTTEYVPAGAESFLEFADTSLFLYNGTDGTSALIANHVPATSVSLSQTGASVAYTVTSDDSESFEGFFYREGIASSIGRNALPIAVSDDGLCLYYVKYDKLDEVWIQKLFAKNGENEIKLDEFADGNKLSVYLNLDFTQIVYSITGRSGVYFICGEDGEKAKISNGYTPIYPYGMREVSSGKAVLTPYESFSKTVFCNASGAAQYLDNKNVSSDLGANGTSFRVSPDGKTVYYLDKDEYLYSCTVRKVSKKEIAPHVMTFELSADGEYVYYINSDNELHAVKGNKDTTCADNVYTSKTVGLAVTDGGFVYFLQDYAYGSGTLCYIKGDGAFHVLSEINNVHDLAADVGEYIYYRSDFGAISGSYDLYYGKGKKYTKLFEKMG